MLKNPCTFCNSTDTDTTVNVGDLQCHLCGQPLTNIQLLKSIIVNQYGYKRMFEYASEILAINGVLLKCLTLQVCEKYNLENYMKLENTLGFILYQSSTIMHQAKLHPCFIDITNALLLSCYLDSGDITREGQRKILRLIRTHQEQLLNQKLFPKSMLSTQGIFVLVNCLCDLDLNKYLLLDETINNKVKQIIGHPISTGEIIAFNVTLLGIVTSWNKGFKDIIIRDKNFKRAYQEVDFEKLEKALFKSR